MSSIFDKIQDNLSNITFSPKTLKLSDLKYDNIDSLLNSLKDIHTLTSLDLSSMNINEKNFNKFYQLIINNPSLTKLNLYDNDIYNNELILISKLLMNKDCKLTELNLSYNTFEDESVIKLAKALEKNKTLTKLDLSLNHISDDGMNALSNMIKVNKTLTYLSLYDNYYITDIGLLSMLEALKFNTTLTYINLGLKHGEMPGQLGLYNMYHIRPNDEIVKAVCEVIKTNHTLTTLWLTSNFIDKLDLLYEALTLNKTIKELGVYHVMFKPWDSDRIMCNYGDDYEYACLNYDVDHDYGESNMGKQIDFFAKNTNFAYKIYKLLKERE